MAAAAGVIASLIDDQQTATALALLQLTGVDSWEETVITPVPHVLRIARGSRAMQQIMH